MADERLVRASALLRGGGRDGLATTIDGATRPADLVVEEPDGRLRCTACAHRCGFVASRRGICGVRFVEDGVLRVPFGYVARRYVRPIETNTVYHVLPGAKALTFGMYGCDLRCPYCQNANISQAMRDGASSGEAPTTITAQALVAEAVAAGCAAVFAAYNEPLIAAEWVHAVFTEARAAGLVTGVVSDGHTTSEVLRHLRPVTDVFRVDLKSYDQAEYRKLGGRLDPVLAGIREAKELGYWVEVVTLVVPGLSDDPTGLRAIAKELVRIDPAMPWHINAFYPRYRMRDVARTDIGALVSTAGMAFARGMKFVYVSNVAAELPHLAHTRCPACHEILVERHDYTRIDDKKLEPGGRCRCGTTLPGLFRSSR